MPIFFNFLNRLMPRKMSDFLANKLTHKQMLQVKAGCCDPDDPDPDDPTTTTTTTTSTAAAARGSSSNKTKTWGG